ncbi:MAG: tRNA uridine(34) 5-carboxymethylaminomethyl modification radical SAM/GNAT enzyme Elp3 [Candidatus Heimdallarchaeaceae archaeon]
MSDQSQAIEEIKNLLLDSSISSSIELDNIKRRIARKYHLKSFPRNSDILAFCTPEEKERLLPILTKRKVRTLSGVAIVATMTRPWPCPHGKCTMCPGGPDQDRPQSYTGYEPTAMRGIRNNYDPHAQVIDRLRQLEAIGHKTDKIDIIIMGGTFTSQPRNYQQWFIHQIFDALNGKDSSTLEEAHRLNETAKHRCIGMTVETRPDQATPPQLNHLIDWGVTRVEIGVQSVFDDVLEAIHRGHGTKETIEAFQFIKDSGLKLVAHMMPGLPKSDSTRDLKAFHILFNDPRYRPDEIKVYPTMVVPNTQLYQDYLDGKYKPLTNEEAAQLIAKIKEIVPPYVRIKRILRDIPAHQVAAGPNKSDIRLDAQRILEQQGKRCRCIRCREVGHYLYKNKGEFDEKAITLVHRTYNASKGIEHFLSYEEVEHDVLIGFLRLRELSDEIVREEFATEPTIVVRELHVYGEMLAVHDRVKDTLQWQHRGYGRRLLQYAETIGKEKGYHRIAVISGVGVRQYYKKLGYARDGPYMMKKL